LTDGPFFGKKSILWITGETTQVFSAGRGAEGETLGKGKLSGKRTVVHCTPWRELFAGHRRGKPDASWAGVISQVKGQGSFGAIPKFPFFLEKFLVFHEAVSRGGSNGRFWR